MFMLPRRQHVATSAWLLSGPLAALILLGLMAEDVADGERILFDLPLLAWLLANAGAAALNVASKHAFERLRPGYWTPLVHESTYSFPSRPWRW